MVLWAGSLLAVWMGGAILDGGTRTTGLDPKDFAFLPKTSFFRASGDLPAFAAGAPSAAAAEFFVTGLSVTGAGRPGGDAAAVVPLDVGSGSGALPLLALVTDFCSTVPDVGAIC